MGLCVPFLLVSQETSDASGEPVANERIDESTLVLGEPAGDASDDGVSVSPFSFWDLARMVLVLGCVVGIIYLVFHFLKRAGTGKFAQTDLIRVVGSQSLPGNRAVYLVQVGAQVFMVGAGSESVTLLGEITDKETVDAIVLSAAEAADAPRKSFGELLASLVKGSQAGSLDLMRQQRERLQRLRQ
ncbi:MAG: FliO/MopB family protein [Spirochaetota bacterium]